MIRTDALPHSEEATHEAQPPVLRFVELHKVLPHEDYDIQRATPLIKRIPESGIWLHPPLVAPLPNTDDTYVVLDGANRCYALGQLGFPHILVQVVDYDGGQVELDTWNHVIADLSAQDFLPALHASVWIEETDILTAQARLAQRQALAYLIDLEQETVYVLNSDDHRMEARTKTLRTVSESYRTKGRLDRIDSRDVHVTRQMFPNATALVIFPKYQPAEILVAARDGILLPPGISRHIIQGRALRLNYPLDTLRDTETPLAAKNAALQAWMNERMEQRAVRFYAESTYIFDE